MRQTTASKVCDLCSVCMHRSVILGSTATRVASGERHSPFAVYVFAFLLGCVTAFDSPARQTFVSELVVEADLSNAVALNSTSFNAARMIGPAIAGVLIATVGSGWVFLINAASFAAVLCSLSLLRVGELHLRSGLSEPAGASPKAFATSGNDPT